MIYEQPAYEWPLSATDPLGNRKGRGADCRLVPDVNGEKLAFSASLSLSRRPDNARAKLIFAIRQSIIDNGRISDPFKCVPSVTARQFLQYISRIVYFFRDLVTFVANCFNSSDILELKAKRRARLS